MVTVAADGIVDQSVDRFEPALVTRRGQPCRERGMTLWIDAIHLLAQCKVHLIEP